MLFFTGETLAHPRDGIRGVHMQSRVHVLAQTAKSGGGALASDSGISAQHCVVHKIVTLGRYVAARALL